jgi:AraC-like DNA-binding protein
MKSPVVPPPGLVDHATRTALLLSDHFDHISSEGRYRVRRCASWAELAEQAQSAPPSTVLLVRTEPGDGALQALEQLMRATPSVPAVVALSFRAASAEHLRAALATGISEVVNLDLERTFASMHPTLRRAHARPLKRRIEAQLPVWVSEHARTLLRAAAETVVDGGGREVLASIFAVQERTVADWTTELGLQPPRRLLGWMRVLLALTLLEEANRTVRNVAESCGYSDDTALKRAVENFTGAPSATRAQTFATAFEVFRDELWHLRESRREARIREPTI